MMILKGNALPSYDYVICFSKFELRFFYTGRIQLDPFIDETVGYTCI